MYLAYLSEHLTESHWFWYDKRLFMILLCLVLSLMRFLMTCWRWWVNFTISPLFNGFYDRKSFLLLFGYWIFRNSFFIIYHIFHIGSIFTNFSWYLPGVEYNDFYDIFNLIRPIDVDVLNYLVISYRPTEWRERQKSRFCQCHFDLWEPFLPFKYIVNID